MLPKCNAIHKTIVEQFKHAIVYGQSVKHQPQRVGLTHELADEDISKYCPFLKSRYFVNGFQSRSSSGDLLIGNVEASLE